MEKLKQGFTLIELLVVIAIIALLLSIIVPALGKAKTYAQEIVCKSNLHQYQIATEIYCNENNEELPDPWESLYSKIQFSDEQQRYCRWHNPKYNLQNEGRDTDGKAYAGPYWPYLSVTKANVCSVFARLAPNYGGSHYSDCIGKPFEPQFSYSMNAGLRKTDSNNRFIPAKKSQVVSPSQTFLWAEENMWTLTGLSTYVLNDNALLVGVNGPIDCFGSFHKISKGKLSIQQNTRRYESGGGVANVLMVDGSLTWLTPEDSVRYRGKVR
jgi:prepilin-type N-terminal cleavage/methylation domain-containing protein/prepilin-type processing-associated H-X9-DG protein